MGNSQILNASCRVALAAFLHDIGKFAERARIREAKEDEINRQLYCPEFNGRRTHVHAAYTAIAIDLLEKLLPEIVGEDMTPFAPWKDKNADDSIINAAAKHHRPETFLQWIIASTDRLASGFEREEFDSYNAVPDEEAGRKLNHYTTRQLTLLEGIRLGKRKETRDNWRYALDFLSVASIFPVEAKDCETDDKAAAQEKHLKLWNAFNAGLNDIPHNHRQSLPLWLDHFESLWLTFTHAIPSATVGNTKPDVSLYDHSKTTAALSVALWRYHADQGHDFEAAKQQLRVQWDKDRAGTVEATKAWETPKFLLIQGDFFGIQDFIFAEGGQTTKYAAKLLRGRSFYVSLLTELAALKVLDALDLPSISQVVNAAGKFLIVAPNTQATLEKLRDVQVELDAWFLAHTFGQSGLGLAWLPAASKDFRHGKEDESPFRALMKKVFEQLEETKLRRYRLCGEAPAPAVFDGSLDSFEHGECRIDGRSPATVHLEGDVWVSALAFDQIHVGKWLASEDRLLVTRHLIQPLHEGQTLNQLKLPVFDFHILFTRDEEKTGKFSNEARSGNLLRAWDFSLPESGDSPLWNGYARRYINAFVPRFGETSVWENDRYAGIENLEDFEPYPGEPKTLNHLAREDQQPLLDDKGQIVKTKDGRVRYKGVEALMTLKGDVDNLGLIFQQGLERPTFAKMAALSRQMNAFFSIYLPWLCKSEYPNTYTVFAGGDDFFLIGPWHSTIKLARRMKDDFKRYVAENPDIHFSAGLSMTKPGLPIRQLAGLAEKSLDEAKAHNPDNVKTSPKNAVTCFGQPVTWTKFDQIMQREEGLRRAAENYELSTGYLYGLLHLTDMAGKVSERPENAIWHSYFRYRTRRLAETRYKDVADRAEREERRRRLQENLAQEIKSEGIEQHDVAYKIALFTYLYQQRD